MNCTCKKKIWILPVLIGTLSGLAAEIPVPIQTGSDGTFTNWKIRASSKTDVTCVQDGKQNVIRFNKPKQTVMIQTTGTFAPADFMTVRVKAAFKGKGTVQIGFHLYGAKKAYCGTYPGKKYTLDSPDRKVPLENVQILGRYGDGYLAPDLLPAAGYVCVYAYPGTEGEISDFSYELIQNQPDTTSPIASPEIRKGVPPLQHRLVLPDTIYAVEGVETNIYFDNIFLSVNSEVYGFDVDCRKGNNFKKKWSFTPTKKDVGIHPWTLRVIGENGLVAKKTIRLCVAPADAGSGRKISLLMVGDSITEVTTFPEQVHALFKKAGNPELTMIGTRPVSAKKTGMAHEGYAGWTWGHFLEKGPFIVNRNGKRELDVADYLTRNHGGKAPDFITIQLGVNDIFGSDDFRIYSGLNRIERNMDKLVAALRKAAPNAVIGIGLPTPCASQDGMGRIYRCGQTKYQYTKNRFMLSDRIMRKYKNGTDKNIRIIPMYHNLDCEHNFPMQAYPVNAGNPEKQIMPKDGLHPAPAGGNQLGDTLYAWLKWQLYQQK